MRARPAALALARVSVPFPQGVTDRCQKFNGDMSYQPIANADCYNTTASE